MLKEDLTLRRLMKPQPSPVDCQMMMYVDKSYRHKCGRQATHCVVVDAGCWRAVCVIHSQGQRNLGKPGKSFEITYDVEACPHLHMELVDAVDPNSAWSDAWHCTDCDVTF